MTERERLERNTNPTKALAARQKHKHDLKPTKNTTSNESDESRPQRVWSYLPDDIVKHIIGKTCWSDRIRLPAVCKSMRSLVHGIEQNIDKFPWLMSYNWRITDYGRVPSICRLVDPSAQKSYVIEEAIKGEERMAFVQQYLALQEKVGVLFHYCLLNFILFFFYSPFTNEVINLPEMDFKYYETRYMKTTFSSNPTSTDCVVLVFSDRFYRGRISTWSHGDKTWTHLDLYREYWALDVTYADGIFYCIFEDGKLGAYNAVLEEWKLFADLFPVKLKRAGAATVYLIESNEDKDLLLMCDLLDHWELWRFDLSRKCWVEEQRKGNRAIFIGCKSHSVPAVGRSSILP